MAEKSSFFNSVDGDRKYQASDFANYFNSLITNGSFPNPSNNLQVMSNNDMTVTIEVGKAWINGFIYINDSTLIMPIEVADGVLKRIDRVVVQYSTINREIKIKVKKGTFASSPVAPVLVRDADLYELGIADILVSNGVVSIVGADITDLRMNTTYCGWVNSLIQADTTAIFDQYQAWFTTTSDTYNTEMTASEAQFQTDFDTWFNAMKDQLTTDAAGNLQTQITTLEGAGWTTETVKGNADAIVTTNVNVTNLDASVTSSLADTLYQLATGTGTAITLTLPTLVNLYTKTFIASADNSGSATTINSKPLYKPNTVIAPNLTTGKAYTVWYNLASDCFFLKASAEGDATVADVLAPKTFSNGDDTGLIGAMVDRGTVNITPSTVNQAILEGKHSGLGIVSAITISAGNNIAIKRTNQKNNSGTSFDEMHKITVGYSGTIRIEFNLKASSGYSAIGQIFKNGSACGYLRTTSSTTYVSYTEDIAVIAGDRLTMELKSSYYQKSAYCSSFTASVSTPAQVSYID